MNNDIVADASNTIINIDPTAPRVETSAFKKMIITKYIQPTYLEDLQDTLKGRFMWRKISDRITGIAKILIIISGIFAFAGAKFTDYWWLSFISGILNALTLSFFQYGMYASNQSKTCTDDTNVLLKSLGIEEIPDIEQNNIEEQTNNNN